MKKRCMKGLCSKHTISERKRESSNPLTDTAASVSGDSISPSKEWMQSPLLTTQSMGGCAFVSKPY